jgi:hypothetical protein
MDSNNREPTMSFSSSLRPPGPWILPSLASLWPFKRRQELPTAQRDRGGQHGGRRHPPSAMPHRPLPAAPLALSLLLVSASAEARADLRSACVQALPRAQLLEVGSFADAVLQLARDAATVVVLDLVHLGGLSPAAALLLRGLAPRARLVALGDDPQIPGVEAVADAAALQDWLRRADRNSQAAPQ